MGLALCRDATGKGPACPGLECCTEEERGADGWSKKTIGGKERKDNDRKEERKWKRRNEGRQEQ